ncbi:NAD(P)H-hydrate epimerase [Qipengyuania sediminis]|uniref:NAD(P)H-hydrate epimerase n=1 Tax=Qipengyuania sediminis TaxID=1532023 RepID=UPI00105A42A4|nr:NAD(P)H-hydrate epimerase [Qipengyuania sediminis]
MAQPVLTAAAIRAAERLSGESESALMARAGAGAAEWVWRVAAGRAVTVLAGPGNNGGDGYVVAEHLRARGLDVAVVAPADPVTVVAQDARAGYAGTIHTALGRRSGGVLVDALFGHGLARPLASPFAELLSQSIGAHDYRVAVDLPSGVVSDSGAWLGVPWTAQLTLALGAWKPAHWLMPAAAAMGQRRLVEIGLPPQPGSAHLSERPRLRAPAAESHKYTRGLVAIVAGRMPGASLLAGEAAMHAGAGYVKLFAETGPAAAPPELVVDTAPLTEVLADRRIAAVVVGPGLGRDEIARARLAAVLDARHPAVLDADALHLLDWDAIEGVDAAKLLLTPHEGELGSLCRAFGVDAEAKPARAQALRDATGASVLAKGPDTLLAPAGGGLVYLPPAPSWLSVAGSGDVLAGIAGARLAGNGDAALAGEEAAWLHREAARIAGASFTAGGLARAVRQAVAALL